MPAEFNLENGNTGVFRISGKLHLAELSKQQEACEQAIKAHGNIKLLAVLENFLGWAQGNNWGDLSFSERNDEFIDQIAIVGDEKWRDLAYAFTCKGLRSVDIKYFSEGEESQARAWLAEG